jgi:hypothetical protein
MKNPNMKSIALVAALATVAATSWAMNESVTVTSNDTYVAVEPAPVLVQDEEVVTVAEPAPAPATVPAPVPAPVAIPVAEAQPPVTIEERRLSVDERIQADVMDAIYRAPNISGKIGVESHDSVVTLTGYTITPGMANRAGRYAGSVQGVKYVQNELRTRIGGSI